MGSTSKMGAGTNVQDKLIALHHLDCAWKPSDLTQRNGRMIRQGNENEKVFVYSYVTEKTFDAYMYQLVEQKQKFISQIMTSKTPVRTMEEDTIKLQEYTKPNMDGFSPMIIDGKEYSEKADAGKKLLECTQLLKSMEVREIGEYRGFKMEISFDSVTRNIKLKLKNKFSYTIDLGVDAGGNIIRINNCLENIARDIPLEREKLDNTKLQLENAKGESQKEFPQEQELKDKQRKLDSINAELKINDDDHEILGDEQEELIRNLDSEELKIKSNEEWIRKFEKNMHIDKLDNIIINELIEDIQVHDNGNINIIFKYQDEFIEAIDFIKREKYDIMLKNVV